MTKYSVCMLRLSVLFLISYLHADIPVANSRFLVAAVQNFSEQLLEKLQTLPPALADAQKPPVTAPSTPPAGALVTTLNVSTANDIGYFNQLVQKSEAFDSHIGNFKTTSNRIKNIAGSDDLKKATIAKQARDVHPILHTKTLEIINEFLNVKRTYGSKVEKALYTSMNQDQFITRLLTNRPLAFYNRSDDYLLRNFAGPGAFAFTTIGTDQEQAPLVLRDYLSYDEMAVSALLGVATPTYFLNDGNRYNKGTPGKKGTYQETGVYVGLVGARFEKENVIEYQHMVIDLWQNTSEKGYGQTKTHNNPLLALWEKFYNTTFPTYEEAVENPHLYIPMGHRLLHKEVYKKRLRLTLEPFFLDANTQGRTQNKQVYLFIVGLGMGVWALNKAVQEPIFFEVCNDILQSNSFSHISDITFSHFTTSINLPAAQGIKIHFNQSNPAEKLTGENANKLLVACYAWDGNSYPGNEYWVGALSASGDPAAASCSTIAELQNPLINEHVSGQYKKVYGKKSW